MRKLILSVAVSFIFVLLGFFVFGAAPTIQFASPTPANGSSVSTSSIFINLSTTSSSGHYSFVEKGRDVLLWLRFETINGSGIPVDSSRYGINATSATNVTLNTTNRIFNNSLQFNSTNISQINYGDLDHFDLPENFTISSWVYRTTSEDSTILAKRTLSGDSRPGYSLGFPSGATIFRFRFANQTTASLTDLSTPSLGTLTNRWVHVVVVKNSANVSIYVNGSISISNVSSGFGGSSSNSRPFVIGALSFTGQEGFTGSLDEIIIFNRSLSASEILSLYNASANQYSRNFTGLSAGNHTFTGYAMNGDGETNSTQELFLTLSPDSDSPAVTLISPANGVNVSSSNQSFYANFTDGVSLLNSTLFIWNSTNGIVNLTSRNITGTSNSSNISFILPYDGTFKWNYRAYDGAGNSAFASSNFTILLDSTSPLVSLTKTSSTKNSITVTFSCTDDNLVSCSLSSSSGSVSGNIITGLSCGTSYSISVQATDLTGNTASASGSFSTDSCSSGGFAPTNPLLLWTTTFSDNVELKDVSFIEKTLGEKQRVRIKVNGETHHVGVISVSSDSAVVNISSKAIQSEIKLNESKKFEINEDNYYDLSITLKAIENNKAKLGIAYIQEEILEEEIVQVQEEKDKGNYIFIIFVVIGLLVILFVVYRLFLSGKGKGKFK